MFACLTARTASVALLAAAPSANAECVIVKVDVPTAFRVSDLVFTGMLVKVDDDQQRLTLRPEPGKTYLVLARIWSTEKRKAQDVNPDEPIVYGMSRGCGAPPWPLALTADLDKIAKSRRARP
jgi:hypothetical protein